jgi:hypothetical protein
MSIHSVDNILIISSRSFIFLLFSEILNNSDIKLIHFASSFTFSFQLSSGLKFWISLSLSTINLTATD